MTTVNNMSFDLTSSQQYSTTTPSPQKRTATLMVAVDDALRLVAPKDATAHSHSKDVDAALRRLRREYDEQDQREHKLAANQWARSGQLQQCQLDQEALSQQRRARQNDSLSAAKEKNNQRSIERNAHLTAMDTTLLTKQKAAVGVREMNAELRRIRARDHRQRSLARCVETKHIIQSKANKQVGALAQALGVQDLLTEDASPSTGPSGGKPGRDPRLLTNNVRNLSVERMLANVMKQRELAAEASRLAPPIRDDGGMARYAYPDDLPEMEGVEGELEGEEGPGPVRRHDTDRATMLQHGHGRYPSEGTEESEESGPAEQLPAQAMQQRHQGNAQQDHVSFSQQQRERPATMLSHRPGTHAHSRAPYRSTSQLSRAKPSAVTLGRKLDRSLGISPDQRRDAQGRLHKKANEAVGALPPLKDGTYKDPFPEVSGLTYHGQRGVRVAAVSPHAPPTRSAATALAERKKFVQRALEAAQKTHPNIRTPVPRKAETMSKAQRYARAWLGDHGRMMGTYPTPTTASSPQRDESQQSTQHLPPDWEGTGAPRATTTRGGARERLRRIRDHNERQPSPPVGNGDEEFPSAPGGIRNSDFESSTESSEVSIEEDQASQFAEVDEEFPSGPPGGIVDADLMGGSSMSSAAPSSAAGEDMVEEEGAEAVEGEMGRLDDSGRRLQRFFRLVVARQRIARLLEQRRVADKEAAVEEALGYEAVRPTLSATQIQSFFRRVVAMRRRLARQDAAAVRAREDELLERIEIEQFEAAAAQRSATSS